MEPTLFSFIWKYSRRQQLWLLVLTVLSFPFLYASLELPKRIINDAIGAATDTITVAGVDMTQVQFLLLLCCAFLAAVLLSGLMKMHINTQKGVVAERLLRRLRFGLIARMMRFPAPYFRTTSQGELVSMITSEAEPMGGLMGDALAQPVFQFGQMLTILVFLFMQSVWFGLASVALIPLQAWLIPMLQRQINQLNKSRISEVRHLSSEIGETAAGIGDLRVNGGVRYRLAQVSDRLNRLFLIRFQIYQKKFFMKFLNNMIGHLTPFMFYLAGGYLAIRGDITVGALVAALAAYKDLSSPWKELLTYYNQVQDMSLRWQIVIDKFHPRGMIREDLFEGEPADIPHLRGAIEFHDVTVRDADGNAVLEDVTLTIPPGSRVAIKSSKASERAAFAQLLTREVLPSRGHITLSGFPLNELHQSVIAARIGHAHSRPYLFDGTLGDNLLMPLRLKPTVVPWSPTGRDKAVTEAKRSGNSPDQVDVDWVAPDLAGLSSSDDLRDWWFKLVEAMGIDDEMLRRTLRSRFDPEVHHRLAQAIVDLRPVIWQRLVDKGLDTAVHRFDPDRFNPAVPLGGNLLFAAPRRMISQKALAANRAFMDMLTREGLDIDGLNIARAVIEILRHTFGRDGTDHPLFRKLGIEEDVYQQLVDISARYGRGGDGALNVEDRSLLLTVPFLLTAEQIGPSFPEQFKSRILGIRQSRADQLRRHAGDIFVPISPETYLPRLTLTENAIYGRISMTASARVEQIEREVAEILIEHDLHRAAAAIIYDLPTGLGGANLPAVLQERAAFSRAGIKRPDILVMDHALASHDTQSRARTRERLRDLLPKSTMVFMEDRFESPENYDIYVEIRDGRIDGVARCDEAAKESAGAADLQQKRRILSEAHLFRNLDLRNQRLLAFAAQWFDAVPGQVIFTHGDSPDAVYLCLSGEAELRWADSEPEDAPVTTVSPGRLIGDLSIITGELRQMDLVATASSRFLRLPAEEFRAVIEADASVAMQLLETTGRNLMQVGRTLSAARAALPGGSDQATTPPAPIGVFSGDSLGAVADG
ncbi:ABC transporter transmembrane domain-containing protein [Arenibacterium halophilum]|uniref:Cyclic nucleotide-binding domain-containing protein n=1 Tax=Arenibacterium halophilum TaxID=2583821 RepID=A0ABY2XF26_9RHOB|nr:ABC transporter transmembrane domain-containing protein [Arenibacterium halophilum]TMV15640.1 cyclic nucleotide-binding domain-containing protein [Arenibacterium halophilum]